MSFLRCYLFALFLLISFAACTKSGEVQLAGELQSNGDSFFGGDYFENEFDLINGPIHDAFKYHAQNSPPLSCSPEISLCANINALNDDEKKDFQEFVLEMAPIIHRHLSVRQPTILFSADPLSVPQKKQENPRPDGGDDEDEGDDNEFNRSVTAKADPITQTITFDTQELIFQAYQKGSLAAVMGSVYGHETGHLVQYSKAPFVPELRGKYLADDGQVGVFKAKRILNLLGEYMMATAIQIGSYVPRRDGLLSPLECTVAMTGAPLFQVDPNLRPMQPLSSEVQITVNANVPTPFEVVEVIADEGEVEYARDENQPGLLLAQFDSLNAGEVTVRIRSEATRQFGECAVGFDTRFERGYSESVLYRVVVAATGNNIFTPFPEAFPDVDDGGSYDHHSPFYKIFNEPSPSCQKELRRAFGPTGKLTLIVTDIEGDDALKRGTVPLGYCCEEPVPGSCQISIFQYGINYLALCPHMEAGHPQWSLVPTQHSLCYVRYPD